ncbi:MAG TPA: GNAT family N-acetyltransferase [Dongiaceae bacterium]|nr:GNAT family N-acetyltransferase [Dongiaceae bacterium]
MQVRFLNADDAGEWSRVRREALERDPEAFSSSIEEHQALPIEEVKRRLTANRDSFVVGAFEDGRLVGMAGFHRESGPKTRHKGRVWGVYVTASERGHGVGRRVMEALLERAAEIEGVQQVLLSVTSTQQAALALYQSLGFEVFGTEPRALNVGGHLIDEHYLTLQLDGKRRRA